jgi:transcriptional regulator with XRE-family HTH domain
VTTPGQIIRERRRAHGLTQARLARRAGTTQAAISRLERDELSPTFKRLAEVLLALGEEPEVVVRPLRGDHDPAHLRDALAREPEQRVELAWSWTASRARWPAPESERVAGVDVPFVGRDDLIAMKRAARRPIDLGDIAALTEPERA